MDDRPRIISKLEKYYLVLSRVFFVDAMLALGFVIYYLFIFYEDPGPEVGFGILCMSMLVIGFIFSLCMSIFTFKLWRVLKKGGKSAITKGLVASIVSSLLFIVPAIVLLWNFTDNIQMYLRDFSWQTLLLILFIAFLFLTIILNGVVIATSLIKQVGEYCKAPTNNK